MASGYAFSFTCICFGNTYFGNFCFGRCLKVVPTLQYLATSVL